MSSFVVIGEPMYCHLSSCVVCCRHDYTHKTYRVAISTKTWVECIRTLYTLISDILKGFYVIKRGNIFLPLQFLGLIIALIEIITVVWYQLIKNNHKQSLLSLIIQKKYWLSNFVILQNIHPSIHSDCRFPMQWAHNNKSVNEFDIFPA